MLEYHEQQYFRKSPLGIALFFMTVLMPIGMGFFVLQLDGDVPAIVPLAAFLVAGISGALLWFMQLETKINNQGIYYRYHGWHFSMRHIPWDQIDVCYTRQYSPMWEYGGWGIRWRWGKGRAFNVAGNQGLQVVLRDGSRILFGTQAPELIEQALKELGTWKKEG